MKICKRLTIVLVVFCLLTAIPAAALADASYDYRYEKYYVNGVQGKGLVAFKGSDIYLQINDNFSAATGIVLTNSGEGYTLTKDGISIKANLMDKNYTVNGIKRWGYMAPLIREEGDIYASCTLLSNFEILSSWDFGQDALFITTNGVQPYRNSYQLSNITKDTAVAQNTVTNETLEIHLAGILASGSLPQDFYQTNGTIATLAFDPLMGQDAQGRAYAYVWLGDTLLNQTLLEKGLAQLDPAFAQSSSPYYQQLLKQNAQTSQPTAAVQQ